MRIALTILILLLVGINNELSASTILAGGNIFSQTWTPAGNPYIVQGDITVPSGSTLNIAPGTIVLLASGDLEHSGFDINRVEITVNGSLDVEGNPDSPVQFAAQSAVRPSVWYGIVVGPSASVIIKNADIANAYWSVQAENAVNISYSTIHDCDTGIILQSVTSSTIDAVTIRGCINDGIDATAATVNISNSVIQGNGKYGVYSAYRTGENANIELTQTTLYGNGNASVLIGLLDNVTISNSLITNNFTGIECGDSDGCAGLSISYSDVVDNNIDYVFASAGPGSISESPNYVGAPDNLALKFPSPGIDAGSSINASDHDRNGGMRPINATGAASAQYDMGAYETPDVLFANGFD